MFVRYLSPAVRSAARSASRGNAPLKRLMSSAQSKQSSDIPWIIGSTLVFAPAFFYLVSPSRKKVVTHHSSDGPADHAKHAPAAEDASIEPETPVADETSTSDGEENTSSQSDETQKNEGATASVEEAQTSVAQSTEANPASVEPDVSKIDTSDAKETDKSK